MKYKKIILLLIVFSLVFVFSAKNVNATDYNGQEPIEFNLDTNSCIGNSCKVLNQGTINFYEDKVSYTGSIYKILDAYYNQTSNEVTYRFTTNFANFLSTSDDYDEFTVDDYFALTSDTEEVTKEHSVITASTLNVLLSKYATYIKANSISADHAIQESVTAEAGAYLALAYGDGLIFGVITANLEIKAASITVDNQLKEIWYIDSQPVNMKRMDNTLMALLTPYTANSLEQFAAFFSDDLLDTFVEDMAITRAKGYSFAVAGDFGTPTNSSDTVKNSNKLNSITIDFPAGIDFDINNIYYAYLPNDDDIAPVISSITLDNGSCYITENGETKKIAEYAKNDKQLVIKK